MPVTGGRCGLETFSTNQCCRSFSHIGQCHNPTSSWPAISGVAGCPDLTFGKFSLAHPMPGYSAKTLNAHSGSNSRGVRCRRQERRPPSSAVSGSIILCRFLSRPGFSSSQSASPRSSSPGRAALAGGSGRGCRRCGTPLLQGRQPSPAGGRRIARRRCLGPT